MKEGREHNKRPAQEAQEEMRAMHNLVASDSFDKAKAASADCENGRATQRYDAVSSGNQNKDFFI